MSFIINIYGSKFRPIEEKTYSIKFGIEYSRFWNTLKIRYGKNKSKAKYAPNGINYNNFISYKCNLKKKTDLDKRR